MGSERQLLYHQSFKRSLGRPPGDEVESYAVMLRLPPTPEIRKR